LDKTQPSRISALLAYLLLVFGWLYVLVARRDDEFARFHARQSIILVLTAIAALVVWFVFGWIITWIPYAGPVVATASFGLVMALYFYLFVLWIIGMISALQFRQRSLPVPMADRWAGRLPL
jgi:uncharacterized membrane protein